MKIFVRQLGQPTFSIDVDKATLVGPPPSHIPLVDHLEGKLRQLNFQSGAGGGVGGATGFSSKTVKDLIKERRGFSIAEMRIMGGGGDELLDGRTLEECGIYDEDTIQLLVNFRKSASFRGGSARGASAAGGAGAGSEAMPGTPLQGALSTVPSAGDVDVPVDTPLRVDWKVQGSAGNYFQSLLRHHLGPEDGVVYASCPGTSEVAGAAAVGAATRPAAVERVREELQHLRLTVTPGGEGSGAAPVLSLRPSFDQYLNLFLPSHPPLERGVLYTMTIGWGGPDAEGLLARTFKAFSVNFTTTSRRPGRGGGAGVSGAGGGGAAAAVERAVEAGAAACRAAEGEQWTTHQLDRLEGSLEEVLKTVREAKRKKLAEELESLRDPRKCIICEEAVINTVMVPCGHQLCCLACSEKLQTRGDTKCPQCRAEVQQWVQTFTR